MPRGVERDKDKTLTNLQPYFERGLNITRACNFYNEGREKKDYISHTTIQTWYEKDADVRSKIDTWRDKPNLMSRTQVVDAIRNGDVDSAWKWLESHEREEFGKQLGLTGEFSHKLDLTQEEKLEVLNALSFLPDGLYQPQNTKPTKRRQPKDS